MPLDRTWFSSLVDDDGTGTVGTVWNKAAVDHVYDDVDAALLTVPTKATVIHSSVTGTQNGWDPGLADHTLISWTGASDLLLNGLVGGVTGRVVTIRNIGGTQGVIYVGFNSAPGAAGYRFWNMASSGPTPIAQYGSATWIYRGDVWILVAHEQGAWITVPYSASNFFHSSGTWTVDAGDQQTFAYRLSGRTLMMTVVVLGSSVSGPAGTQLRVAIPGGFMPTRSSYTTCQIADNGAQMAGLAETVAGQTFIAFYRIDLGLLAAATNTTALRSAAITIEVN